MVMGAPRDNSFMSTALPPEATRLLAMARETLQIEAEAVTALAGRLDERFADAVRHFLKRESVGIAHTMEELNESSPFKAIAPLPLEGRGAGGEGDLGAGNTLDASPRPPLPDPSPTRGEGTKR